MLALAELFGTEERVKIFAYAMFASEPFTVKMVSEETGVTKGLVSRYLRRLKSFGFLEKHKKLYTSADTPKVRAVKILLNIDKIDTNRLDLGWTEGIGLFGSWAQGTNRHESDIDVWVTTAKYPAEERIARLQREIRNMAGSETNLLILTPEKIKVIKNTDAPFYNSLIKSSLVLKGEFIE